MKKILAITILLFTLLSFNSETYKIDTQKSTTVYVCGKSKIYHTSKLHSALKRCKSGIKKLTKSEALKLKKRKCKCKH